MRTLYICLALVTTPAMSSQTVYTPIELNRDIIRLIDGKAFGVSGETIGALYKMIRDIQNIQLGRRMPDGERIGMYTFEGKQHTIQSLIAIEKEIKEALNDNTPGVEESKQELDELLKIMRSDFMRIVSPFIAEARSAKDPLVVLIQEECSKRQRPHSLLLEWAALMDDEFSNFERQVTNFQIFDSFCKDLIDFKKDLMHNCKKARKQFKELVERYSNK